MFQRRKRNLDLSRAKEPIRNGQSTHGINWGKDQWQEEGNTTESADDRDLDYGWEEADEETGMEPDHQNLSRYTSKGQSELAFSNAKMRKSLLSGSPSLPTPACKGNRILTSSTRN